MRVSGLDAREIDVRRRWMPWRLRKRKIELNDLPVDFVGGDLGGIVFGVVFAIAFFLFGGILLTVAIFASEALLILPVLVILFAALRILWVIPWVIETRTGATLLGIERIRGWRDSSDRIREIAEAYQRGEDPYAVRRA